MKRSLVALASTLVLLGACAAEDVDVTDDSMMEDESMMMEDDSMMEDDAMMAE